MTQRMTNLNKLSVYYVSYLIIFSVLIMSSVHAQVYFQDFPDDGTREVAGAVGVYHEHVLKSLDYTFNVHTPGFLRKSVKNVRLFDQPDGQHVLLAKYDYKWLEGPQFETGNDLHFCINGKNRSFFTILLKDGLVGYTRDGRFRVDSQNRLVTLSGNFPVLGLEGIMTLPKRGHYTINRRGGFFVDDDLVDTFKIVMFKSFEQMSKHLHNTSGTVFVLDQEIDVETENLQYNILQGVITQSNSLKSYDSWYYKNAHQATVNSINQLISSRRTIFNALP